MDGTPAQSAPPFWGIFHSLYVSLMSLESKKFPRRSISLVLFESHQHDLHQLELGQGPLLACRISALASSEMRRFSLSTVAFRWDEYCMASARSQVIGALEAHETRRPAMKKPSTTALRRIRKLQ
jgi:hypothetical protein